MSQSLIHQVRFSGKRLNFVIRKWLKLVAIPYSSGQVFRPGFSEDIAALLVESQSLIHQVRFSGFFNAKGLLVRSKSRNPLFIRSGFPAGAVRRTYNMRVPASQSLIHQVRFSG